MIDTIIFDLDGTIYESSDVINGAPETIHSLRNKGKRIFFMTNNSSKTRDSICSKLNKMGIDCILDEIYSSGYATALYVKEHGLQNVYVFGSDGLKKEFSNLGISTVEDEFKADTTVIGFNINATYEDIAKGMRAAINSKDVIACNRDRTYPGDGGLLYPGCGYPVATVEWCANKKALCIGKPNTIMLDILCRDNGLTNENIMLIGDTFESDIQTAINYSAKSILIGKDDRAVCANRISDILDIIE